MRSSTGGGPVAAERRLIRKEKRLGNLAHQREAAAEADHFWPSAARAVRAYWEAQLRVADRAFRQRRYGCFCGPGNVCGTPTDTLDLCCRDPDAAYAAVGVTSGAGPGVGMWTAPGLKLTESADAALVACARRRVTSSALGPTARAYAVGVVFTFNTRTAAAAAARQLGL